MNDLSYIMESSKLFFDYEKNGVLVYVCSLFCFAFYGWICGASLRMFFDDLFLIYTIMDGRPVEGPYTSVGQFVTFLFSCFNALGVLIRKLITEC